MSADQWTSQQRAARTDAPLRNRETVICGPESDRPPGAARWTGAARAGVLITSDLSALLVSGLLAFILWASGVREQPTSLYVPFAFAPFLMIMAYAQARLYPGFAMGSVEIFRRYTLVTTAGFGGLAALVFVLKLENVYSRMTLGLAFIFSIVLLPIARHITLSVARRWAWWPEPAVLFVTQRKDRRASLVADGWQDREIRVVYTVSLHSASASSQAGQASDSPLPGNTIKAQKSIDSLDAADGWAQAGVKIALIDIESFDTSPVVDRLRLTFPRVIVVRRMQDLPVEGVQVRNLDGLLGLEYGNNLLRRQSRWVKRGMDILVAAGSLVVAAPIVLVSGLIVKLVSPGPALFFQAREGRKGKTIQVAKIRTMVVGAEQDIAQLLDDDPHLREEWESGYKLLNDPRVLRGIGPFLRRFSIDECPQLLSVLKGDMSLVGPRPFPSYHLDALGQHSRQLRAEVRPGITGLWQVTARGIADVETQQAYDLYYIRNWSIWLDIYILARTFGAVVTGRGAH